MQSEQREAGKAAIGETSGLAPLERETRELGSGDGELLNAVKVLAKGS
jgi:hypothetical protein